MKELRLRLRFFKKLRNFSFNPITKIPYKKTYSVHFNVATLSKFPRTAKLGLRIKINTYNSQETVIFTYLYRSIARLANILIKSGNN